MKTGFPRLKLFATAATGDMVVGPPVSQGSTVPAVGDRPRRTWTWSRYDDPTLKSDLQY